MHTVPTGRATEIVEVYDTTHCDACGSKLASPHVLIAPLPCSCAGSGGHRTLTCLGCGHVHYEPPHTSEQGLGSAYG